MAWVASVGRRGLATDREYYGDRMPERVRRDPESRASANRLVFRWCALASVLCLTPLAGMAPYLLSDWTEPSTPELVIAVLTVLAATAMAEYPFHKLKR